MFILVNGHAKTRTCMLRAKINFYYFINAIVFFARKIIGSNLGLIEQ